MPSEQQNEARQRDYIKRQPILEWYPIPQHRVSVITKVKAVIKTRNILMKNISWKSKLGGVMIALAPLAKQLPPQWHWVAEAMVTLGGTLLAFGRDNNVSSEDAGAK